MLSYFNILLFFDSVASYKLLAAGRSSPPNCDTVLLMLVFVLKRDSMKMPVRH